MVPASAVALITGPMNGFRVWEARFPAAAITPGWIVAVIRADSGADRRARAANINVTAGGGAILAVAEGSSEAVTAAPRPPRSPKKKSR